MAKKLIKASSVVIGGNTWDAYLAEATLTVDVDNLDTTNFDGDGWREFIGGLKSGSLSLNFKMDADLSNVDAYCWTNLGATVTFVVKVEDAALGPDNPSFSGNLVITNWGVGGSVGDLHSRSVSWPTTGAITRATA